MPNVLEPTACIRNSQKSFGGLREAPGKSILDQGGLEHFPCPSVLELNFKIKSKQIYSNLQENLQPMNIKQVPDLLSR